MKKITIQQIKDLLPQKTYLLYVDRNDSLCDNTKDVQHCLTNRSLDHLYESICEWYKDCEFYNKRKIEKQLSKDMQLQFDIDETQANELMKEYCDEIEGEIYDRDNSDTLKQLISNTNDMVVFCETGLYIDSSNTDAEIRLNRIKIKNILNIKNSDFDKDIDEMLLNNSGYGGDLRIYFRPKFKDLINSIENYSCIKFNANMCIAIVNSGVGSGADCLVIGSYEGSTGNLFLCKEIKYSYTYEICGMYSNWCEITDYEFTNEDCETIESSTKKHYEKEQKLDQTFRSGSCTIGDINFKRHRDVFYINDYPCGSKCPHCGTFWID